MRILHTSDWHLGRTFYGTPLLDQQVSVLSTFVDVVRQESIDVVVLAGDVYDRAIPGVDAVTALDEILGAIRGAGARIVGISGNHDSGGRLGFGEKMLTAGGVTLRGDVRLAGVPLILPDRDGSDVVFYPIPYLDPDIARFSLDADDARTHSAVLQVAVQRARADLSTRPGVRSVAIAHAFVHGGEPSESEAVLAVGGAGEVMLDSFAGFDYVALGHLHGRQRLTETVRYSGSPLAYSFSEKSHHKGAWIVDLGLDGSTTVTELLLPVQRRLATMRGELEALLVDASLDDHEDCFLHVTLTDAVLPMEAMSRLRSRFPHVAQIAHNPPQIGGNALRTYVERTRDRDDLELVFDFVEHVTGTQPDHDEQVELEMVVQPTVDESSVA